MALHRDIHWIGRQWAVTGHGMQVIDQKLKGFFDIEVSQLWDEALIETMRAKEWLNVADFDKGLEVARKRFPPGSVTSQPEAIAPAPPVASAARPAAAPIAPDACAGFAHRTNRAAGSQIDQSRIEPRPRAPDPLNRLTSAEPLPASDPEHLIRAG